MLFPSIGASQSGGQAEIAAQGYYLAGQRQTLAGISGVNVRFQQFVPRFGLLQGSFDQYASQGRWRAGDNSLELRGFTWGGYRWTFSGGDLRFSPLLTANPFTNVFYPEVQARGFGVEATRGQAAYSLFYGVQTLLQGPRIPYRIGTGQVAAGGSMKYRAGEHLQFGFRLLHLTGDQNNTSNLILRNYSFGAVNTAAAQVLYNPAPGLRFFAEASLSAASSADASPAVNGNPASFLIGAAYEAERITFRANYADQGASYLPVAGYLAGDRRGPFGEFRIRPVRQLELFASASRYRNNREEDLRRPTYESASESAGVSLTLPSRFSLSTQLSRIRFDSSQWDAEFRSDNLQWTATLARPTGRHNLRATYRDMRFTNDGRSTRQISREFEDLVQFRQLVIGGSARLDTTIGDQTRNTVFTRGTVQFRRGRWTAYSYFDIGRDLVNATVFTTNAINSTVFGASGQLAGGWTIQAEAFRNTLAMAVNPSNVFLLSGQGVAMPAALAGLNQWSMFVRAGKQIRWGAQLPAGGLDRYTAERLPITGVVEGEVYEVTNGGRRPVAGIPVTVDGSRTSLSNSSGGYRLTGIPEGQHHVGLQLDQLPANFEPGPNQLRTVLISTRRLTRIDFEVVRLTQLCGSVADAPDPHALENLIIHLRPTPRYTTPDADGTFCFHNLRPGNYVVELDAAGLPPLTRLAGSHSVEVRVDLEEDPVRIEFRLVKDFETKPVRRKILETPPEAAAKPRGGSSP